MLSRNFLKALCNSSPHHHRNWSSVASWVNNRSRSSSSRQLHCSRTCSSHKVLGDSNLAVGHSRFLAEAPAHTPWRHAGLGSINGDNPDDLSQDEFDGVGNGRGKILPTSSHLFKLILPLGDLSHPKNQHTKPETPGQIEPAKSSVPPTVILLHPSQPLSHVGRLITMSLAPAAPVVSFRSTSAGGQAFQWSDSTDVGDFIRDAARSAEFTICISYNPSDSLRNTLLEQETSRRIPVNKDSTTKQSEDKGVVETVITVEVPTFTDRTRYLRRRLKAIEQRLHEMELLKKECDREAHRGARRMALTGFGALVVYWAAVARLTFWDYGWDIMEPITYLSGLSTVILGYLWFLYQGREVSYSSVLAQSISRRRDALYRSKGLDIAKWEELVSERRALKKEIGRIAEDYEDRLPRDTSQDESEEAKATEVEKESLTSEGVVEKIEKGEEPGKAGRI
ncbi:hypothetical protein CC1G_11981 [Coprinopsis cinerea okayama7|uniref:Calcium uniporter protein, mitochondrial n=1 Tax=Coprinopsis cinerea (strain Okayama-7 / 130 / ATCC MYA-4618 / FGSC 9003) TaxID=240176 RepID=A8P0P2_COPC7|nr:hypothetical protein CC1G_11981 [Coprinopsis cinerea okayama7\|eukprot:XP_001837937.2 hypothetical protein CC1G_11981 [Coprinopsis cinerea okayama7\